MADVGPGQRGSIVWTAGTTLPSQWILLGDATNIRISREKHEYLPDNNTNNAVQRVPGAITAIAATLEGTVDLDVNLSLTDWFTLGATVAKSIILKLSSARTYTFDAFIFDVNIPRRNRDLTRWTGEIEWDGVSTVVIA